MPGARDALCHQALQLLAELCARGALEHDSCQDFIYHLRDRTRPRLRDPDISISLLTLVVTACGLALFGVSLFVSWKLCWVPWRERGLFSGSKDNNQEPLNYTDTETNEQENSEGFLDPPSPCPDSSMKISHTSPDIPLSTQVGAQEHCAHGVRMKRQVTEPASSTRHNSIRRQLNLSNPDFNIQQLQKQEHLAGIGRIKPELYKQRSLDNDDGRRNNSKACGKLNFILKYDCDLEQLIVKIHKAVNLPAKDFSGTSDPYVKIYLLPDRKTKHQTKVHRKTLNPVFDEVFLFPVPYNELAARKLHFSVYDFDRFSRHDLIGQVVVDHFLDLADFPRECILWKDIEYVTNDNVDLGELMFSLCYLPTAGRLTITVIKARNLKAMDITGASDPYVKVSLMCDGRRLKKRKTSTKRNTLNPVYNEAIVFDVPPDNIDQIHLSIAVMDYDRIGHNEIIGVCQVGNKAERLGRDHWSEMLSYPRKPIAHWHSLVEGSCYVLWDFSTNVFLNVFCEPLSVTVYVSDMPPFTTFPLKVDLTVDPNTLFYGDWTDQNSILKNDDCGERTALLRLSGTAILQRSSVTLPTQQQHPDSSSDQMLSCNHSNNWPSFQTGFGEHEWSNCLRVVCCRGSTSLMDENQDQTMEETNRHSEKTESTLSTRTLSDEVTASALATSYRHGVICLNALEGQNILKYIQVLNRQQI